MALVELPVGLGPIFRFAWRESLRKHLPLYMAGVVLGVGAAVGLSLAAVESSPAASAPVAAPASATSFASPDYQLGSYNPGDEGLYGQAQTFMYGVPGAASAEPVVEMVFPEITPPPPAPAAAPAPAPAPVAAQPRPAPAVQPQPAPQPAPPPPSPSLPPNFYLPDVAAGYNANEQAMVSAINAERARAGLGPLAYDSGLGRIARIRSKQMVDQGYFSHVDPYGYHMYTELLSWFGYGYAYAGENLAMNNYPDSVGQAMTALMNSPSHRANILGPNYRRIGVGEMVTADGRHFFTMIFLG
jgi:uncharacterized protein YkwD